MNEQVQKEFCKLYESYIFVVRKRIAHFFKNRELVSDLTQEVFYKVLVELQKGNQAVANVGYLIRLTTNLCIDQIRKHELESKLKIESNGWSPISFDGAQKAEKAVLVHQLLNKLPPSLREIAVYRFIDGYSLKEMARIIGMPKRSLQRKLSKLQRVFDSIIK